MSFKSFITDKQLITTVIGILLVSELRFIIGSLTDDVILPVCNIEKNFKDHKIKIYEETDINIGSFISTLIKSIIIILMAFALWKMHDSSGSSPSP